MCRASAGQNRTRFWYISLKPPPLPQQEGGQTVHGRLNHTRSVIKVKLLMQAARSRTELTLLSATSRTELTLLTGPLRE